MRAVLRVDQLRRDPHTVAGLAHTAVEHGAYVQQASDFAAVHEPVLELERGGPSRDAQTAHVVQRVDDLLGGALAEIILVLGGAHVGESKHGDRCRFGRCNRRQIHRARY